MAVVIQRATYGDDKSNTDVTSALANRISGAGSINIPVNSSLIPFFTLAESATLSDTEVKQAKDRAVELCGGQQDQVCIAKRTEEVKSNMLDEKRTKANRVDNIVRGNRLELVVQEGRNVRKIAIPEGQMITEESLRGKPPKGSQPIDIKKAVDPPFSLTGFLGSTLLNGSQILVIFIGAIVYILGILVTWKVFNDEGYVIPKYVATATSVVVPGSGLVITPLFFGLRTFSERVKSALDAAKAQNQSL